MEGHWKFLGRGVLTVKILVAKYEAKVEFPGGTWVGGGGGVKQKTFRRGVWIFSGTAQWAKDHLPFERELENCEPWNCCFQYFEKNNYMYLECSSFVQAKRKQKCRKLNGDAN